MLTSTRASLASRIERDILIADRCGVHDTILGTLRTGAGGRCSGGARATGAVATGAGGVSGDAEAAVSAAARRRRASSSNPCDQVELEFARAPPQRVGVTAGELIGDLVYMRDVAPASFGRRRGPAATMASAQATSLGGTFLFEQNR